MNRALLALAGVFCLTSFTQGDIVLYGLENGSYTPEDNRLHAIDYTDASIISSVQVTLPGHTVGTSTALTIHPTTGILYAVITTVPQGGNFPNEAAPRLVTLDPETGVATLIGDLAPWFAGLAFTADGRLIGVTGDGSVDPESLFEINTTDASITLLFALGNGTDGEAIAMHGNGLLYHASGWDDGDEYFESVNLTSQAVTDIGDGNHIFPYYVATSLAYSPDLGEMYVAGLRGTGIASLYTVDVSTGAMTHVGDIGDAWAIKGMAFANIDDNGGRRGCGFAAGAGQLAFFWCTCLLWLVAVKARSRRARP